MATPATEYRVRWSRFDNPTGSTTGAIETTASGTRVAGPPEVLADAEFVQVEIASQHAQFSEWKAPVTAHFRRNSAGWALVGVTRAQ